MSKRNPFIRALFWLLAPLPGTAQTPFLLTRKAFAGYAFMTAFVLVLLFGTGVEVRHPLFLATVTQERILQEVNPYREALGLPLLQVHEKLEYAAQQKAEDMARRGYFSHRDPDGESPWVWLDQAGYRYAAAGENLARDFVHADRLVEAWLASPAHAKILQNGYFQDIGIGIAEGEIDGQGAHIVVAFLGREIPSAAVQTDLIEDQLQLDPEEITVVSDMSEETVLPAAEDQPAPPVEQEEQEIPADPAPEDILLVEVIEDGDGERVREIAVAGTPTVIRGLESDRDERPAVISSLEGASDFSRNGLSGMYAGLIVLTLMTATVQRRTMNFVLPRVAGFTLFGVLLWLDMLLL